MFPLPDLPLDIIIRIFSFASQVPATYQALCLVSKASRTIVLDHAFSSVPVHIGMFSDGTKFAEFISSYPEIAPRILTLRMPYQPWDARAMLFANEGKLCFILHSCINITSLSATSTVIQEAIGKYETFVHRGIVTLFIYIDRESTASINKYAHTQALMSQVETLYVASRTIGLFDLLLPSKGATWNFANLTRIATQAFHFPDYEMHRYQIFYDRSIFPCLQKIVLQFRDDWRSIADLWGMKHQDYRYSMLLHAKKWDAMYLIFEPKKLTFPSPNTWIDMGDSFWDAAVRLVDHGGDVLLDPPEWPDEDIFV